MMRAGFITHDTILGGKPLDTSFSPLAISFTSTAQYNTNAISKVTSFIKLQRGASRFQIVGRS